MILSIIILTLLLIANILVALSAKDRNEGYFLNAFAAGFVASVLLTTIFKLIML
jgi:hypothetical protein